MEKRKIVGMGESVLDIIFRNNQPLAAVPGGSTFNAMVSLGRTLGVSDNSVDIVMLTQVGDDYVADLVAGFMEDNHLSTEGLSRRKGAQSTVSMAFLNERNDARYEFFRDGSDNPELFREIDFHEGDIVLFGSFFAVSPALREYTRRRLTAARKAGAIIYYDINFRKNHLADLPATIGDMIENIRMSDFVRGSSEDIYHIFGTDDATAVYEKHIRELCKNFICTRGAGPVELFSPDCRTMVESRKVGKVVSTVGAGDNFNAGFVYGLCREGVTREHIDSMTEELWTGLAGTAGKFSANVCGSIYNYVDMDFVKTL